MLQLFQFQVLLVFVITSLQQGCFADSRRGFCATAAPDDSLKAEFRRLSALEGVANVDQESRKAVEPIEIATWFHVVSSKANGNIVSDEMLAAQLSSLQEAYRNATITYRLEGVTRQTNDKWARNEEELAMKDALRKGSYRTLNVYFQTDLQAPTGSGNRARQLDLSEQLATSVLGFCTLPDPSINVTSPRSSYVRDGCNVLANTMPGGSLTHYNRGGTAIHEIGHWNGLLHTFEGESCSPENEGDYIDDTPQESLPTDGCPALKDSCPDNPGADPIHNFMDYSSDECYERFTPSQVKRMRDTWYAMREGK
ncbi:zinc metalloprotease [Aspergillus lucknowensis]|uniref:Peptidase M43 pregnancy-associated plasma-A domain-containing protein n=1 Tax=Aspergillus lucknowensis TaxID=176173 RepID=A0ABR4LJP4_9EURO